MQKYPIGIQDFKSLREGGYLYIDKTKEIANLLETGKYYFLSRPRRFGKSLLISTLEAVFLGQKEFFEGLWIEDKITWKTYPVIRLDFSAMEYDQQPLDQAIYRNLQLISKKYQLDIQGDNIKDYFNQLITKLSAKHGKVAILIDEYDKPIIDFLDKEHLPKAQRNRSILKQFYSVIKSLDAHLHFFFLTGVSKFSKVSIFSDLNHLNDITMHIQFSKLVGYTQEELENYFPKEIEQLANIEQVSIQEMYQKIKVWYNGYRWNNRSETVYNPFSILNLMSHQNFSNFWFETGTPTFLVKLLKEKQLYKLENLTVKVEALRTYEIENLAVYALMFQTGYLTIARQPHHFIYELKYPNLEVKQSFEHHLLTSYANQHHAGGLCYQIAEAFQKNELETVEYYFKNLLAEIPYPIFDAKQEKYYQAIFYLALKLIGVYIEAEVHTNIGRMDAVIQNENTIYIIEFKVNQSAEVAIQQIHDRKYYEKYQNSGKKIALIGMNCYDKTVKEWLIEWL